jgi:ribonuclease HI
MQLFIHGLADRPQLLTPTCSGTVIYTHATLSTMAASPPSPQQAQLMRKISVQLPTAEAEIMAALTGLIWTLYTHPHCVAITLYTDSTTVNHTLPTGKGVTIR